MNYGVINYQKQNGKSGIFWQQEQKKADKKNFGYRKRDQKFFLRTHPRNADRIDPNEEPFLKISEPEKKKPEKDFIARNRTQVVNKNKKPVKKGEGDKGDSGLITLTQSQLNAILASVGQVVSGKEDNLRISVDSSKNEIKIESPRKTKEDDRYSDYSDDDKYSRDRHEKEVKKPSKKKEKKDDSIFGLLGDSTDRDKRKEEPIKNKRKDYKLFSDEEGDNDSAKGEVSRERRRDRSRQRSRERHRKRDETPSRERERSRENDNDRKKRKQKEEELNHKNREKDMERDGKTLRKEKFRDDKLRDYDEKERNRKIDRDSEKYRDKKTDRDSEKTKNDKSSRDNEKSRTKETEEEGNNNKTAAVLTPREMAGIPLSLPWKHMTKAERYRLMRARMQAEEAVKEAAEAKVKKAENERLEKEYEERKEYEKKRRERDARKEKEEKRARERREREREDSPEIDRRREDSRDERRGRRRDDSRDRWYRNDSRDRRRRDDSYERTRSPADSDDNTSSKPEPKKEITHLPPAGPSAFPKPLTLAEKKRLQWEKERIESKKGFDPWGKPGAGAPIRTRSGNVAADYRSRQEETLRLSIEEEVEKHYEPKPERKLPSYAERPPATQQNVPAAMRSSFIFGQIAPDSERFEDSKELARKQWLSDLEKQMEEKKLQKNPPESDTWAEKSTKPVYEPTIELNTGRVNSAPQPGDDNDENKTYIRGQNVYMDPVTKREQEEKYRRIMEHQKAVMQQVEEKQRLKQMERERKMKEDMEEEMKLKTERDRLQRQFEQEQNKVKMKEVKRQEEIDKLKLAMDEAAEKALIDKMTKRMQHLQAGGHDVSQLKATLEDPRTGRITGRLTGREQDYTSRNLAQLSPRNKALVVAPTSVPGLDLDLSPRGPPAHKTKNTDRADFGTDGFYTENRLLTPSNLRNTHRMGENREFGTQTGMGENTDDFNDLSVDLDKILSTHRDDTEIEILYKGRRVRVKSAPKDDPADLKSKRKPQPPKSGQGKSKQDKKEKGPPVWNFQNKKRKKPVKNSEKDLNFNEKRKESELRRQRREQELIRLVDLNRDIIPTEKRTPGNSRGHSPVSDRGGRTPRALDRTERTRRSKSHSPEYYNNGRKKSSPPPSNRHSSPPIPALRYRPDQGEGIDSLLTSDRGDKSHKYQDAVPLSFPSVDGEFMPFMRTVETLNPAHASSPVPVSREATHITNARKAYIKGMKPGDYGKKIQQYEDRMVMPGESQHAKDPIFNPSLVTDHPTQRQDAILQQLSSLKMNLMQRQRELETFSPTDFE